MKDETILVAMPLYNAAKYMAKALDSILSQTYSDFHVLIIDDGSNDGSMKIANGYASEKLTLIGQSHNGPGTAMNRAIEFAQQQHFPFIARMDADDISAPQRLEVQMQLLNRSSEVAGCSCNCYYMDSDSEEIIGTSTVPIRSSLIKWEIRSGLRGLIQGATLFRTEALVGIGGYRPQFLYAEEADLFLRLSEYYEFVNTREFLYKIRMNRNSLSLQDPHKNLLYHFYALQCSRNRRARQPEVDFQTFLQKRDWLLAFRMHREEVA